MLCRIGKGAPPPPGRKRRKKPEKDASKRVGEMHDPQRLGIDLHHVEADMGVEAVVTLQIPLGGPGEKELLASVDRVRRPAKCRGGAGLHLRENEDARPPLPGYDVDLVAAGTLVAPQYAIAVEKEIPGGQPFSPSARVHGTKWPMKLRRWMGQGPYFLRAAMCSVVP